MKKFILFFVLGLIGLWVVGIVLVNVFDVDLDKYFNGSTASQASSASAPSPAGSPGADWKTYKNDDFHFSIQSPADIVEIKAPSTTNLKMASFTSVGLEKKFVLNGSLAQMPMAPSEAFKDLDQEVKVLKAMDKVMVDLDITSSPATISGIAGFEALGTFKMMGKDDWGLRIFKAQRDKTTLHLSLQFPNNDDNKAVGDKILGSVTWEDR